MNVDKMLAQAAIDMDALKKSGKVKEGATPSASLLSLLNRLRRTSPGNPYSDTTPRDGGETLTDKEKP